MSMNCHGRACPGRRYFWYSIAFLSGVTGQARCDNHQRTPECRSARRGSTRGCRAALIGVDRFGLIAPSRDIPGMLPPCISRARRVSSTFAAMLRFIQIDGGGPCRFSMRPSRNAPAASTIWSACRQFLLHSCGGERGPTLRSERTGGRGAQQNSAAPGAQECRRALLRQRRTGDPLRSAADFLPAPRNFQRFRR